MTHLDRRQFLRQALAAAGTLIVGGCDRISHSRTGASILRSAETLTRRVQRALIPPDALAKEFAPADISPVFRGNGTTNPTTPLYRNLLARHFADWRLSVGGLVAQPFSATLAELRAMPARTQITRHDCVEGWSAIGKWKGVPLADLLDRAAPADNSRFVVFHCADELSGAPYYESIDMQDAFHPQTIMAYELNDAPLLVANGAPLRLRVERQLGYKHAKYVMRIEVVASFAELAGGKGGYWEDRGYEWFAGI
jgi:DMSO/TMAO reductase YedYZ molybdopterin-dependent catalytic subunit